MRPTRRPALLGCAAALCLALACASPQTARVAGHPDFKQLCSQCHTLERVERMHNILSQEDMTAIVRRMREKEGSHINPNDIDDIVNQIY